MVNALKYFSRTIITLAICLTTVCGQAQGSGNTLTFNGSNEFIDVGDQVGNNCRTIEMWFKLENNVTSSLTTCMSLIMRDFDFTNVAGTDEFGIYIGQSGWAGQAGRLVFSRHFGGSYLRVVSDNNSWQANHWYHVVGTIDPVLGMRMYVNGVLQASTEPSTSPFGTQSGSIADKLSIGRWGNVNIRYFEGEIDDVRLWEDARSLTEIRENMCSKLIGTEPGLRACWNFDSTSATQLVDIGPGSYNGVLNNMGSSNRIYSGAPIGDISSNLYNLGGLIGQSQSLSVGTGDSIWVDNIISSSIGVQLYRVNSLPNSQINLNTPTIGSYFGVFLTDISGTFDVSYDYSIHGCSSCDSVFSRNDNAVLAWTGVNSLAASCVVGMSNQSLIGNDYRAEFILDNVASFTLGNDTTLCAGNNITLSAFTTGATYLWQDGSTNASFAVSNPGTYWVQVQDGSCSFSDSIVVSYDALSQFSLGNDTTICNQSPITLNSSFLGSGSFLWQDGSTNSSLLVDSSGTYALTISSSGCSFADTINVTYPGIQINLGNDTILCQGDSILVTASGSPGSTYLWHDGSIVQSYSIGQSGIYSVTESNSGCTVTDSIIVGYDLLMPIELGNDTILCEPSPIILDASSVVGASYLWHDGSVGSMFTVLTSGVFSVIVTSGVCVFNDTINVSFSPFNQINLGGDTVLCAENTIALNAGVVGGSFLWNDGSTDSVLNVTHSGIYSVQVQIGICTLVDTVEVTIDDLQPVNLGADTVICAGLAFQLNADSIGGNTYVWQDGSSDSVLSVGAAGVYWVNVSNLECSYSDTIEIFSDSAINIGFGSDTILCVGETIQIGQNAIGASYLWQDGSTNPYFDVTGSGTYTLDVVSACGSSSSDTIKIELINCACEIFIPNAFTPNSDAKNENFYPTATCDFVRYEFLIFDRWGEKIFESIDITESWDGKYKNKNVPVGVYIYVLNYSWEIGIDKQFKGHVSVIR